MDLPPILQFFDYTHLRPNLQSVSEPFFRLAHHLVEIAPHNPERDVALRKLLEAKDAAVRSVVYQDFHQQHPDAPAS